VVGRVVVVGRGLVEVVLVVVDVDVPARVVEVGDGVVVVGRVVTGGVEVRVELLGVVEGRLVAVRLPGVLDVVDGGVVGGAAVLGGALVVGGPVGVVGAAARGSG